ncbi:hypothetical protein [Vibrio parahaemolyticus]|uniref:hypothetical protein n=1 Tax=Vibrio parahaemolyticus TaxID=670 RepID=UPI003D815DA3
MTQVLIDGPMCDKIRKELNAAAASIKEKLGVEIKIGSMTYEHDGSGASAKIQMLGTDSSGAVITPEYRDLQQIESSIPWLRGNLDKEFKDGPNTYKLTGYKHRSRKYPFIAECIAGPNKGNNIKITCTHLEQLFSK